MKKNNAMLSNSISIFKYGLIGKVLAGFVGISVSLCAMKIGNAGYVISQFLATTIYVISFYHVMWKVGFSNSNKTSFKSSKLTGIICGLIASIPYFLSALVMIIFKILNTDLSILWYRIINIEYFSFFALILPQTNVVSQIDFSKLLIIFLPLLIMPLMAQVSYTLGFKKISLSERIIYKKKKG